MKSTLQLATVLLLAVIAVIDFLGYSQNSKVLKELKQQSQQAEVRRAVEDARAGVTAARVRGCAEARGVYSGTFENWTCSPEGRK